MFCAFLWLAEGSNMKFTGPFKKVFVVLLMMSSFSVSVYAQEFETIYGRKADVLALRKVLVKPNLQDAVSEMLKSDLLIYKVPVDVSSDPELKDKAKTFDFLPAVPEKLKAKLQSQIADVSGEGALFVTWNDFDSDKNVILISEYAKPGTVFHEFTHHLFEAQNRSQTLKITAEQQKFQEFLRIYNRRVSGALMDDYSLSKRSWRENYDEYVNEYSKTFDNAQGYLNAEEVAIEVGLFKLMIEVRSPHFDLARAKEGILLYSQNSIVNGSMFRVNGVLALMDKIRTGAKQPDSDWTPEEENKRAELYKQITRRLEKFKKQRLGALQSQIDEAKEILEAIASSPYYKK